MIRIEAIDPTPDWVSLAAFPLMKP